MTLRGIQCAHSPIGMDTCTLHAWLNIQFTCHMQTHVQLWYHSICYTTFKMVLDLIYSISTGRHALIIFLFNFSIKTPRRVSYFQSLMTLPPLSLCLQQSCSATQSKTTTCHLFLSARYDIVLSGKGPRFVSTILFLFMFEIPTDAKWRTMSILFIYVYSRFSKWRHK